MKFKTLFKRIFNFAPTCFFAAALVTGAHSAYAQKIFLIRDAEIENTIRQFAAPVFRVANLNPADIRIHLVKDNSLNAFVTAGQRLFINTGLLTQAKNPGQIIGVIAHETGHISGGHLARMSDALAKSSAATILSVILGGAAIIAGQGQVGGVIIAAGQGIALRSFLNYTRTQESAADQAGMRFLDGAKLSSRGLLEFMELLGEQELLPPENQDPYVRTHPLTRDRIENIAAHVERSPYSDNPTPENLNILYRRAKAKLFAYLNSLGATLRLYKESDNSLESRYARAVAYYRKANLDKALPLIDGLIAEAPNDPYFWELKGQMLFENGDAISARKPYEKAVSLLPDNALLRRDLGRVLLESNDPALLDAAIAHFSISVEQERESFFSWRQLAIAYGRKGDKGNSSLALAESALLRGDKSQARYHAGLAERIFPKGSREWIQAQDILLAARQKKR